MKRILKAYAIINIDEYDDFFKYEYESCNPICRTGTKDIHLTDTGAIFGIEEQAKKVLKLLKPSMRKKVKIIEIDIDIKPDIYLK